MSSVERRKQLGAYYTDRRVADFLVEWAIHSASDTVLDPSFGDGVFLYAARARLEKLGGSVAQIYGVEIDPEVFGSILESFKSESPKDLPNLLNADFFDVVGSHGLMSLEAKHIPPVDVVIGNPPFIRYHRFTGATRKKALTRAKDMGVELNGLSSAWAPFIVHATGFLKPDGRLAMVAPGEIMHASYALPVLKFITGVFENVSIVTFKKRIFPELSQDAVLLLCEHFRRRNRATYLIDLGSQADLFARKFHRISVDTTAVIKNKSRLLEYLLPSDIMSLYSELKSNPLVLQLGSFATVGIGYVTGNNEFFHLTRSMAEHWNIPPDALTPCVRSGSQMQGLIFTHDDLEALLDADAPNLLLDLARFGEPLPDSIMQYLEHGKRQGVHLAYKCRKRKPWYVVPHVYGCDGLLTYMSGKRARIIVNDADVVAPNTLHTIRLRDDTPLSISELAISWLTSLTALSTEIEGHSLGGGMLKLEPGEAQRTVVVNPSLSDGVAHDAAHKIDRFIRDGEWERAVRFADDLILGDCLGLSKTQISLLREGAKLLRDRRYSR